MPYDKVEAAREFAGWSRSYDRCILQRLLFTPSHDALIGRLRGRSGDSPWTLLDVGMRHRSLRGQGSGRIPRSQGLGRGPRRPDDPDGDGSLEIERGGLRPGAGGQRAIAVLGWRLRRRHLRQQLSPLSAPRTSLSPRCVGSSSRGGGCCSSMVTATALGDGSFTTSASRGSKVTSIMPPPAGSATCCAWPGSRKPSRKSTGGWPPSC